MQENPHKAISWFLYKSEGSEMIYSKSERENLATQDTLPSKIIIQNRRRDKELSTQAETKRAHQY